MADPDTEELERLLSGDDEPKDEPKDESVDDSHGDDHEESARVDDEMEAAESEQEREAIRAKRREERKHKKERVKEDREKLALMFSTVQRLEQENENLKAQQNHIQAIHQNQALGSMDQQIAQANAEKQRLKAIIAEATTRGDGATVAEAMEYFSRAEQHIGNLIAKKQQAAQYVQQVQQEASRPVVKPAVINYAKAFREKHGWYQGPDSADGDSRNLTAIDNALAAEGWDMTTREYWQELEDRLSKKLPHRANANKAPRNPVSGESTRTGGVNRPQAVALSAERVQAMKDAGYWNDPEKRAKMIKSYQDADKARKG